MWRRSSLALCELFRWLTEICMQAIEVIVLRMARNVAHHFIDGGNFSIAQSHKALT
jgi:hypothetical protein